MALAPTPWTAAHDGHGGVCIDDANGRQIGFISGRPEQADHAALMIAAPALQRYYCASVILRDAAASMSTSPAELTAAQQAVADAAAAVEAVAHTSQRA